MFDVRCYIILYIIIHILLYIISYILLYTYIIYYYILYYTLPSIPFTSIFFPFPSSLPPIFPFPIYLPLLLPFPIFILYVSAFGYPYLYSSSIQSFQTAISWLKESYLPSFSPSYSSLPFPSSLLIHLPSSIPFLIHSNIQCSVYIK